MLKDVTLGQFFPGSSIVHRLDPRCKLLLTIVYIAALFTAQSYVSYAVMLISCTGTLSFLSGPKRISIASVSAMGDVV